MGAKGQPRTPGSGRKPRYTSAEQIQAMIDQYFERCEGQILRDDETGEPIFDKFGRPVIVGATPPTVTGLALALGFATRLGLLRYQGKQEFNEVITRAKSRVEAYAEARLFDRDGANGARFTLDCNFKWGQSRDEGDGKEGSTPTVKIICDIPRAKVESADAATRAEVSEDDAGGT